MNSKKWPGLAQLMIAIGVISSLRYIILSILSGMLLQDTFGLLYSIAGLVIFWSVYKLKSWAVVGLNIFLSVTIVLNLISFLNAMRPPLSCAIGIVFSVLMLAYFNSKKIKELFN